MSVIGTKRTNFMDDLIISDPKQTIVAAASGVAVTDRARCCDLGRERASRQHQERGLPAARRAAMPRSMPDLRIITLRTMARSAISTTVRTCTMLSCRCATTRRERLNSERDDDSEDRPEHRLEHRIFGRVKGLRGDNVVEDLECEVPHGEDDDDGDQPREDKDDDLLEISRRT